MSDFYNLPVGKRTRHGRLRYAQGLYGINESGSSGSSKNQDRKRKKDTEFSESEDSDEVFEIKDDKIHNKGSYCAGRSKKRKLEEAIKDEILSSDESDSEEEESDEKLSSDESDFEEEESDENGSGDNIISSDSDESSSDESVDDSSDGEGSKDPSRSNEVIKSSSSESEEDECDEKGSDGTKSRTCGSSSGYKQDKIEIIDVDDYGINRKESKGSSSSTKRELPKAKPAEKSLVDESKEEQSNENGSRVRFTSIELEESSVHVSTKDGSDGEEGTDTAAVAKNEKTECYGSAIAFKSGTHKKANTKGKQKESKKGKQKDDGGSIDALPKTGWRKAVGTTHQSTAPHPLCGSKGSSSSTKRELHEAKPADKSLVDESEEQSNENGSRVCFTSIELEESSVHVSIKEGSNGEVGTDTAAVEKNEKKECYGSAIPFKSGTDKKANSKGKQKEDGGSIDALLDSIGQEDDVPKKERDNCIPLKFRFDESDDESASPITYESDVEALFQQMNFELQSEEVGSYGNPKVENQDKDDYKDHDHEAPHMNCKRGNHSDIYLEEETGLRCRLCGAVILESRHVIPTLANYAPDRSRRGHNSNEQQFVTTENLYFQGLDGNPIEVCMKTKGTVWELIPGHIRKHLFGHQQEGFKFLWENLAGTIELQTLHKLGSRGGSGGGGCIISHAPGTGKTLLTIVFMETFLKMFSECCPVIVAPASILLTWEAEFKKWKVGISFINLSSESLTNMNIGRSKNNKDLIRAMKIRSWSKGGSVLGLSYNLYEQIAGSSNTKNVKLVKMGKLLLDLPRLVVLDEGHTPRSERSNIWNILLKLKTKNLVILSGTPFQNNFRELFNTLRLVRPGVATNIANEKVFARMIQGRNSSKPTSMSNSSEAIESLKVIIAPFVNVHKGHILESKLPGLKQSIILLNPPPLQKGLIESCRNVSNTNFEYEHKVALVSVHPSLILHCSLSEKEEKSTDRKTLENVRLHADVGAKTRIVMELIRLSISLGEKVLIFSQYIQPLELLKDQIALVFGWEFGREFLLIKGRINQKLRQTIISDFNNPDSESKVLLASTKCCSEGIHLIGASRVVLLDIVWNPAVEKQAISRAYRLGQKKVVHTYHLMTAGTTEEDKYDRQVEKGRLAEMVFSSSGEKSKMVNRDVSELDDKILQKLVDHQELKDIFNKITYPENKICSKDRGH